MKFFIIILLAGVIAACGIVKAQGMWYTLKIYVLNEIF